MKGLLGLNEPQREAARHIEGPLLILAGAGTGKTRVIITRIAYLIAQGIPADQILAVTFTNKAASEMRERVGGEIARDQAKEVTISTFHSLCVKILRKDIDRLGYKRNFSIYAAADQLGLVRKLVVQQGGREAGLDPKVALSMIGQAKNRGLPPSAITDQFAAEIAQCYADELKTLNAVDFDDLLTLTVELLDQHEDVRGEWQDRFRFLMVDEFQDTNGLQMALLRNLAGHAQNVCVVGDDDQSIYGWRGADISNILEFERHFPNPRVVKLEENYRCTTPVLGLANSIIRHNRNRREKTLWCSKESEKLVRLIGMPSAEEEAEFLVGEMTTLHQEGRAWEHFAVLFRMNAQSRILEQTMRAAQIPYRVVGGMSFFDRREVRDLLAYLTVLMHPDDDVNLLRVINNPPRGLGQLAVSAATNFSVEQGTSVWSALQHPEFLATRTTKVRTAFEQFAELLRRYQDVAQTPSGDYATMTGQLLEEIGYIEYLRRTCKTSDEAGKREECLREFIDSIYDHRARTGRKEKGLQHFLDEVQLSSDREDEEDVTKKSGVCLITMHAAKGLEFPIVYIVGLEEGILPHSRSVEEGTRDEERRLLYVGITRAMESLTLSYCSSRKRYGEPSPCQPSSFIKELDRKYLEEISFDDLANEPASDEAAANYFEQLKAMLSSQ